MQGSRTASPPSLIKAVARFLLRSCQNAQGSIGRIGCTILSSARPEGKKEESRRESFRA